MSMCVGAPATELASLRGSAPQLCRKMKMPEIHCVGLSNGGTLADAVEKANGSSQLHKQSLLGLQYTFVGEHRSQQMDKVEPSHMSPLQR